MPHTPADPRPSRPPQGVSRVSLPGAAIVLLFGSCALIAVLAGTALARPGRGGYPPSAVPGPELPGPGQRPGGGQQGAGQQGVGQQGAGQNQGAGQQGAGQQGVGQNQGAGPTGQPGGPPPNGRRGSPAQADGGGQHDGAGAPQAQAPPASGSARRMGGHGRAGRQGSTGTTQDDRTSSTGTAQTGTATATVTATVGPGAGNSRHHDAGGNGSTSQDGSPGASGGGSSSESKGGSSQSAPAADTSAPAATGASSLPPAIVASAEATPASTAAPSAPTPSTPASPTAPSASRAHHHGGRPHGASRRRHRARRGQTARRGHPASRRHSHPSGVPGAGGLVAGTALSASGADGSSPRPRRHPAAGHNPAARPQPSPLSTTITRIVDVVPAPLRIIVALLVALSLLLALRSRLAALSAKRLERQRAELLADVGLLQAALLPAAPPVLGEVGTSVAYRPADGPAAGGDFYDVFALGEGRVAVILGDVSGHGRQALPHTALVRFTLRAYLEAGLSPRLALQTAGHVLDRQLGESFATVVAAVYDPLARTLVYSCAGHPPPLVIGTRSPSTVTACSAPPVGAGLRTGTRQTTIALPGHARICFHTDGVTEARVDGELYGSRRLAAALAELQPEEGAPALLAAVARQTDARPDDMAACLLDVPGGDDAPRIEIEELELDRGALTGGGRLERFLLACGIELRDVPALIDSARATAGPGGTVVLELRHRERRNPQVTLRRETVPRLRPPTAPAPLALGATT
ncbi:MAG TPA: SpoIIE family protein phosphatase [Solirubrobacteraceae bacterium]|nr:SpoIIE family protein phosphatase [Solirubrobacteraceae bacterium]